MIADNCWKDPHCTLKVDHEHSAYGGAVTWQEKKVAVDMVNHPPHYNNHPSGVECIDIVKHMNFCRGGAIKYIWRAGMKGDVIEDLEKARWLLAEEIKRLKEEAV